MVHSSQNKESPPCMLLTHANATLKSLPSADDKEARSLLYFYPLPCLLEVVVVLAAGVPFFKVFSKRKVAL